MYKATKLSADTGGQKLIGHGLSKTGYRLCTTPAVLRSGVNTAAANTHYFLILKAEEIFRTRSVNIIPVRFVITVSGCGCP